MSLPRIFYETEDEEMVSGLAFGGWRLLRGG